MSTPSTHIEYSEPRRGPLERDSIGPPKPDKTRRIELELIARAAQELADQAPPLSRSQLEKLRESGLDQAVADVVS